MDCIGLGLVRGLTKSWTQLSDFHTILRFAQIKKSDNNECKHTYLIKIHKIFL